MRGNILAWLVLLGSPLAILAFYSARQAQHRVARTTAWAMLLSAMFLPSNTGYDPPLLPEFDKHRIAYLTIALALQLYHRPQLCSARRCTTSRAGCWACSRWASSAPP
jgi:hypothetical protein